MISRLPEDLADVLLPYLDSDSTINLLMCNRKAYCTVILHTLMLAKHIFNEEELKLGAVSYLVDVVKTMSSALSFIRTGQMHDGGMQYPKNNRDRNFPGTKCVNITLNNTLQRNVFSKFVHLLLIGNHWKIVGNLVNGKFPRSLEQPRTRSLHPNGCKTVTMNRENVKGMNYIPVEDVRTKSLRKSANTLLLPRTLQNILEENSTLARLIEIGDVQGTKFILSNTHDSVSLVNTPFKGKALLSIVVSKLMNSLHARVKQDTAPGASRELFHLLLDHKAEVIPTSGGKWSSPSPILSNFLRPNSELDGNTKREDPRGPFATRIMAALAQEVMRGCCSEPILQHAPLIGILDRDFPDPSRSREKGMSRFVVNVLCACIEQRDLWMANLLVTEFSSTSEGKNWLRRAISMVHKEITSSANGAQMPVTSGLVAADSRSRVHRTRLPSSRSMTNNRILNTSQSNSHQNRQSRLRDSGSGRTISGAIGRRETVSRVGLSPSNQSRTQGSSSSSADVVSNVILKLKPNSAALPLFIAVSAISSAHNSRFFGNLLSVCNANTAISSGKTALFLACESGNWNVIPHLLDNGALIDNCTVTGRNAVFVAVEKNYPKCISSIINSGQLRTRHCLRSTTGGIDPIGCAVQKGRTECLVLLLSVFVAEIKAFSKIHEEDDLSDEIGIFDRIGITFSQGGLLSQMCKKYQQQLIS